MIIVIGQTLAVATVLTQFDFLTEEFQGRGKGKKSPYLAAVLYVTMTTTTVGYGNLVEQWEHQVFTMFLEMVGIIFYGWSFQQMMKLLSMAKTYEEQREEQIDNLDTWLIRRERKIVQLTNKKQKEIRKLEDFFGFVREWDIQGVFDNEFYHSVSPEIKFGIFKGPVEYLINNFGPFFKAVGLHEENMIHAIVHAMQPKM